MREKYNINQGPMLNKKYSGVRDPDEEHDEPKMN